MANAFIYHGGEHWVLCVSQALQSVLQSGAWTSSTAVGVGMSALLAAVGGGLDGAAAVKPGQVQVCERSAITYCQSASVR